MALEIHVPANFRENLKNAAMVNPGLINKFHAFVKAKIQNFLTPFGKSDKLFGHILKTAVPGENLRHAHLDLDVSVVYSITGTDTKVMKVYGLFSHAELGTDVHQDTPSKRASTAVRLANIATGQWIQFTLPGVELPSEIPTIKIDDVEKADVRFDEQKIKDILIAADIEIPSTAPLRTVIRTLLRDTNNKALLIKYNAENPVDVIKVQEEFYLRNDDDRHLLFLLQRIGKKRVAANIIGDRRATVREEEDENNNESNLSWEELLYKHL